MHKRFVTIMVMVVLMSFCFDTFAQRRPGPGGEPHGPRDYYWRDGHWWAGDIITALTVGTIIATLPPRREIVYVENVPYYYDGTYYYRRCPEGYIVVSNPVIVAQSAPVTVVTQVASNTITINVPGKNGGFVPVTLTKYGNGYLGPQGEYYEGNPTVEQLKALYGR